MEPFVRHTGKFITFDRANVDTDAIIPARYLKITSMEAKIDVIRGDYNDLVVQLQSLDANLTVIEAQEVAKKTDLAVRKKLLAERLRSAYDSDRTSLLETFLSGSTFTDTTGHDLDDAFYQMRP